MSADKRQEYKYIDLMKCEKKLEIKNILIKNNDANDRPEVHLYIC